MNDVLMVYLTALLLGSLFGLFLWLIRFLFLTWFDYPNRKMGL
jgi:hypothetical protein